MASPSRSGSVASTSPSASFSADAILRSVAVALRFVVYFRAKSRTGSTEPSFAGRSRTMPRVANTSWPAPRTPRTVFALAGDSTTTTCTASAAGAFRWRDRTWRPPHRRSRGGEAARGRGR